MVQRMLGNGRYELESAPLARGGMGEVWAGRDVKLDRPVVVKFLRFPHGDRDRSLVARFVRESRITARLEHPGVPAVFDVGTDDGRPYVVMQRIRGTSLADLLATHGALPIGWAAAIATQVCAVLTAAHQNSLVHRDLKPANLMICPDGSVKVLDFGLAVALAERDEAQLTLAGQTLGTPAYMAPEQVLASSSDPRVDLYAVGCTLYEMLTGHPVFSGETAYSVMRKQVDEPPPSVRTLRLDVPLALDQLVGRLLRKKPEQRTANAAETARLLLPFITIEAPLPMSVEYRASSHAVPLYAAAVAPTLDLVSSPSAAETDAHAGGAQAGPTPATGRRRSPVEVQAEAAALVKASRYDQAVEVVDQALVHAEQAIERSDPDVLELRRIHAEALFDSGDFQRAAPAYHVLAELLPDPQGSDIDELYRCRFREASAYAMIGETPRALRQLEDLLQDESTTYGPDDARPLELRRQIALLEVGAGNRQHASIRLRALLADLIRVQGENHADVATVRKILDRADSGGTQR